MVISEFEDLVTPRDSGVEELEGDKLFCTIIVFI
jgi:hypothetical protein